MSDLRWGVLSTAKIGVEKVIPGIQRSRRGSVVAIASRDLARAQTAAADLGIPKAYGSYEDLLADPDIDAIYNPLPNNLHVDLTLQAAAAGKAVLCEKPIGMDQADAERLRSIEGKVPVMEAFMVRFHPQWHWARDHIRSGGLGEVRAIQAFFSFFNRDPANIRNAPETGGGALLDIGCYPIVAGRFFFEAEPQRVFAMIGRDPDFKVDSVTTGILDFGDNRRVDFTVSTQVVLSQRLQIVGTSGRLEIEIPFNAPQGEASRIFLHDGKSLDGSTSKIKEIPAADQYAEQADAFAAVVFGESPLPYGIEDAIQNMRIIDALFRSENSGAWEDLS